MKKIALSLLVLALVFTNVAFAAGQQETTEKQTTIKLSIPDPANSSVGSFAKVFAEKEIGRASCRERV